MFYYTLVQISPYNDGYEFSFSVVQRHVDSGTEREFTSGYDSGAIFTKEDREAILDVILAATDVLLGWKRPRKVDRCTSDPHLPPKAIRKHLLISEEFRKKGYRIREQPSWHG